MNKYINNLNPYVFVVVWVILLAFLANLIPSMLTAASTFISDGHNYSSLPSGILSRVTGKCKIYKLI